MDSPSQLHILFFPYMAQGHMIPTIDMARLFARQHGVKATIVTTPRNAPLFSKAIERDRQLLGVEISTRTIKFPSAEAGLAEGIENLSSVPSPELIPNFYKALTLFQHPLESLLQECKPPINCLVADMMFTWATEVADKFGIPRLFFNGTCCFSMCVFHSINLHQPHQHIDSDFESFIVPGLPDKIKMTRLQLPSFIKEKETQNEMTKLMDRVAESEVKSYGVLLNTFHELEPAYSDHYRNVMGRKTWNIGPLSICNKDSTQDKAQRGDTSSIDEHICLKWLDSKKPNSVFYISFGSVIKFSATQLLEIALALESSGQNFIWVVKNEEKTENSEDSTLLLKEEWLPEGFEERMEGKGLIIRGWAPQVLILDHESIGGFMSHCGWNSTLEAVSAGVPMVTWPLCAEQFSNEKLIIDVLKIGVGVGSQEWSRQERKIIVGKEDIKKAVIELMVGEEGKEMRERGRALKEMARRAVEEGGSSFSDLNALLEDLRALGTSKQDCAAGAALEQGK